LPAFASRRPRYGGVLRMAVENADAALYRDPAESAAVGHLVYEKLLRFGEEDRLLPWLASDWSLANGPRREWAFRLRDALRFHDGSVCDAMAVATALQGAGLRCTARGSTEVLVSPETPVPLFRELAEARRSVRRTANQSSWGTGAFRVLPETPASDRHSTILRLAAFDAHWQGRPFVDEVQIVSAGVDPVFALEAGAADLARVPVQQAARVAERGARLWRSRPVELIVAETFGLSPEDRVAASLATDRESIQRAMLQGEGTPSASLLPDWMSGYGFLFPVAQQIPRAREHFHGRQQALKGIAVLATPDDPLLGTIASRLALDLGAAGLAVRVLRASASGAPGPSLRLRRVRLHSQQPAHALRQLSTELATPLAANLRSAQGVYEAERFLLAQAPVIPIAHLPDIYAVGPRLRSSTALPVDSLGRLHLDRLWLEKEGAAR
jgi:hypothetical protein